MPSHFVPTCAVVAVPSYLSLSESCHSQPQHDVTYKLLVSHCLSVKVCIPQSLGAMIATMTMALICLTPEALTEQEYETVALIGALIGRWTLFTISALQHAYSRRSGILYRITGYLAPRWRGVVMSLKFLCVLCGLSPWQRENTCLAVTQCSKCSGLVRPPWF